MSANTYFADLYTATDADQALFDDLIVESIKVHGRDFYYLPRTLTNFDSFFGEDSISAFNSAVTLEFYMENVQGWEGDGKFLSKFGLEIRDEATLTVARSRFREEVTSLFPDITVPREGDVIVFPSTVDKRMRAFEISYVNGESVFYQLGELYIWKLTVRNFEYNGESFNTGVDSIDDYETESSIATIIDLGSGAGVYEVGETAYQPGWSAMVINHDVSTNMLTVTQVNGVFDPTEDITGDTSGAIWNVDKVVTKTAQQSGHSDNQYIDEAERDLISFSKDNPFSER